MAITEKNILKNWFLNGLKPPQEQFWAWQDSYFHKYDLIPAVSIEGLVDILNAKAEAVVLSHHIEQKGMPNGYTPLNEAGKVLSSYLVMVNDLVTGGENPVTAEQAKILQEQINVINVLLKSDDIDLDTLQEIVDKIKEITIGLNEFLVNDLTTGGITKALTAEMGKVLELTKENKANKSLVLSSASTDEEYPSSKAVYDFMNAFVKTENNLTTDEVLDLVENNQLIPGNYYQINDFQTIYTISGSDSTPPTYKREITSYVSAWAALDYGYDYVLVVGKMVTITKLPVGYSGTLVVGQTTTVSSMSSNFYFKFANGMQNLIGLEFSYTTSRYANGIADNLVVNDANGKPVIRPGGVLNTEVHNGTDYMNMTAAENLGVPVEVLILKAKTTNEFELEGKSATYPDDVIEYRLPETGSVAVKGTILRRYNNYLNIDIRDDWRVKRYRRWKIDAASILKILNRDQDVASLTGFAGVYQFTATKSTPSTPERFYIAQDLDSISKTVDANTKISDFYMAVSAYTDAKDYPIFGLNSSHHPVDVVKMKVTGNFYNVVIQRNLGELNFDTNVNAEELTYSTFVCSFDSDGNYFVKINNCIFLDSVNLYGINLISLSRLKVLSYIQFGNVVNTNINNCVFGVNTNNYSGTPYPSVRWSKVSNSTNSIIENSLLGTSGALISFNNSHIKKCTLYFYLSRNSSNNSDDYEHTLKFNNCFLKHLSIFNRARLGASSFDNIRCNPEYIPATASQRDLYVNSTDLLQTSIRFNKYTRKLYYEDRDASDVLTITTYALPT